MEDNNKIKHTGGRQISVIVPVYKVEPYLRQCIDSILAQTFTDFELILVDDGSPDNCGAICDEYAEKDDRIVVIHQENGGLSAARNAGLDWVFANSDSQWITFVDSDDYIVATYLEHMARYAVDTNADIVTTNATYFWEEIELKNICLNVISSQLISGKDACKELYNKSGLIGVCAWGKLYKRTQFDGIRFPVGLIHEDDYIVPKVLFLANKIAVLRSWLYFYRQTSGSIMHKRFSVKRFDGISSIDSCISFFLNQGAFDIACLAGEYREKILARYTLLAYKNGIRKDIPVQFRMSLWKACKLIAQETIISGGIHMILVRLNHFWKK